MYCMRDVTESRSALDIAMQYGNTQNPPRPGGSRNAYYPLNIGHGEARCQQKGKEGGAGTGSPLTHYPAFSARRRRLFRHDPYGVVEHLQEAAADLEAASTS